jgi:hypothetical protein
MGDAAKSSFECSYTNEIVCPHCGHEHSDSWEIGRHEGGDSFEGECAECEKKFGCERINDVTYSTFIPEPEKPKKKPVAPPEDRRFARETETWALNPGPREGEYRVRETYVDVWEDHCNAAIETAMIAVMQGLLRVLHTRGFTVERHPRVLNGPSCIIANDYWYARRGDLEVNVEHTGRVVKAEFYQNLNRDNQNGGEYDYNKLSRMPKTMQMACIVEMAELVRRLKLHGYTPRPGTELAKEGPLLLRVRDAAHLVAERPTDPLAYSQKHNSWKNTPVDEQGFLAKSQYAHWSYRDRDGAELHAGDTRYFYEGGHLMRGLVYPGTNGSWFAAFGGAITLKHTDQFFADPDGAPRRFVPKQAERLHAELEKAVKAKSYRRAAALGRVLHTRFDNEGK